MTPIDRLLERLEGVRQNGERQYLARCPAHDDDDPSLSIRVLNDRVLIHCFAGCDAPAIVAAAGLSLSELFVHRKDHKALPTRKRWDACALLKLLRTEATVTLMAAHELHQGRQLEQEDRERLRQAVDRIARVAEVIS